MASFCKAYNEYVDNPWTEFNEVVAEKLENTIPRFDAKTGEHLIKNAILRSLAAPALVADTCATDAARLIVRLNQYEIGNLTKTLVNIFAAIARLAVFAVCVIPAYIIYPIYVGIMALVEMAQNAYVPSEPLQVDFS